MSEAFVPGVMRCAKCNFVLHRVTLHVNAGGVSAGDNKTEPCPNGCGPLWPMTWRQHADDLQERCEEQVLRAVAAEGAIDHALTIATASEERIAQVYDLIVKAREAIRARLEPGSDDLRDVFQLLQDAKYGIGGRTSVEGTLRAAVAARTASPTPGGP